MINRRFDSTCENGYFIPLKFDERYDNLPIMVLDALHKDAKSILPPDTLYEIRATIPDIRGWHKQLAWYYHPNMTVQTNLQPRLLPEFGYFFISQHRT